MQFHCQFTTKFTRTNLESYTSFRGERPASENEICLNLTLKNPLPTLENGVVFVVKSDKLKLYRKIPDTCFEDKIALCDGCSVSQPYSRRKM